MLRGKSIVGLLLVAGLLGFCVSAEGASAHDLKFKLSFDINPGTWMSNWDCQCNHDNVGGYHTVSESDNRIILHAQYILEIPRRGNPGPLHLAADAWSAKGKLVVDGAYWTDTNPDTPLNCTGDIAKGGEAPAAQTFGATSSTQLNFYIQSGKYFRVVNFGGANCDSSVQWQPFWPTDGDPKLVTDMFTAKRTVSLTKLRAMHVGNVTGTTFHEPQAKRLPKTDCEYGDGGTCTQSLHWTGHLAFTRIT